MGAVALAPVAVREAAGATGPPILHGYAAVWNEWTEIKSALEGHFLERFAPGAFARSLRENRDRIRVLFQHGRDTQLGKRPLGEIRTLEEDGAGLRYEVELFEGVDELLLEGLRAGQYGASMRFLPGIADEQRRPARSSYNPERLPELTHREASLLELGPVTFPAYASTSAGLRFVRCRGPLGVVR